MEVCHVQAVDGGEYAVQEAARKIWRASTLAPPQNVKAESRQSSLYILVLSILADWAAARQKNGKNSSIL